MTEPATCLGGPDNEILPETALVPRTEGRIKCAIWDDQDYLALGLEAKLAYQFIVEQRDMTLCGLIPYRPTRWSRLLGLSTTKLESVMRTLESSRFVAIDREEGELWVRTFMRHDHVQGEKLLTAARGAISTMSSRPLRAAFAAEYPALAEEWGISSIPDRVSDRVSDTPLEVGGRRKEVGNGVEKFEEEGLVGVVFAAWEDALPPHGTVRLTITRRSHIEARLREYPLEDVVDAAVGVASNPWSVEHRQTELEIAMRSGKQLERYRDLRRSPPPPEHQGQIERVLRRQLQTGEADLDTLRYAYPGRFGNADS